MAPRGHSEKILPLQWSRIKPHCDFLVPQVSADIGLSAFYFRVSAQLQANLTHERAELSKSPNFRSGTRIAALGSSQRSPTRTRLDFCATQLVQSCMLETLDLKFAHGAAAELFAALIEKISRKRRAASCSFGPIAAWIVITVSGDFGCRGSFHF
jgi:hypothetical protein